MVAAEAEAAKRERTKALIFILKECEVDFFGRQVVRELDFQLFQDFFENCEDVLRRARRTYILEASILL